MAIIAVKIPKFPECWESCDNCGSGEVIVDDLLVFPRRSARTSNGRVLDVNVAPGDKVREDQVILTLELID